MTLAGEDSLLEALVLARSERRETALFFEPVVESGDEGGEGDGGPPESAFGVGDGRSDAVVLDGSLAEPDADVDIVAELSGVSEGLAVAVGGVGWVKELALLVPAIRAERRSCGLPYRTLLFLPPAPSKDRSKVKK